MNQSVGIRSLAVTFPSVVRTNDYFRENFPELIAVAEDQSLAKILSSSKSNSNQSSDPWVQEAKPYLSDLFRGTVERRALGLGESSLTLELDAARKALEAAKLSLSEIDLLLVSSFFSENLHLGNAAYLAEQLGINCPAWNLDSMCASGVVALQTASAFIRSGEYKNILVVTSCTFSRFLDAKDTVQFSLGDGASAFVVAPLKENQGILGTKAINSHESCGIFFNALSTDANGNPKMVVRANRKTGKKVGPLFSKYLHECCFGALEAANITLDQIDFFTCFTATAWYSDFCVRELGIDPEKTINVYPKYGNIGAVSTVANLYHAAESNKIRPNDLVLFYSHGFVSSAAAIVMRWGDVALGPVPTPSESLMKEKELAKVAV
ncbi:MAG: 3-oxoacyl-ACP synthase III family protein [Okeania sp. SIO3I5]|uniref:3-oxoacyl-ACP synthase III family protein n=1 Tax=Okeania sp. SIO3I5 TaxID=2607805 RepID=UPI0013B5BD46|nr:3-oxoacyl-ACP synthase III family protein [Okeania sp. SIO3I5]NEQ40549.1 3-oxoacyl-ACP synthase III family protein [Okeania sp. SIO3I5]